MPYNFKRPRFATTTVPLLEGRDILRATASLNYASIAAAADADLTIAVPGATVGDDVTVHYNAAPLTALRHVAYVSAVNVVTVRAYNHTAVAIDAAAEDISVIVWKN